MPWRAAADPDAWVDLSDVEHAHAWDAMYQQLAFQPSTRSADWPSFREPPDSLTWDISGIWDDLVGNEQRASRALLDGLRSVMGSDPFVYAMDWQHPCYRFLPDRARPAVAEDSWLVPALPNGDYYLFVALDLRFGWLGHPWEQSICVFGSLAHSLRGPIEELGWPLVRSGGQPTRQPS